MDTMHPCGPDSGCFIVFGGEVSHNETWHRLREAEAALRIIREAHRPDDADDRLCIEGCGGGWPCTASLEAATVLGSDQHERK